MKRIKPQHFLILLLVAAMVVSLAVPAFAADGGYSATPYTYDAGDYTFGKISHANKAPGTPDGLVDYTGNGTVSRSVSATCACSAAACIHSRVKVKRVFRIIVV